MTEYQKNIALSYLNKDPVLHTCMTESLRRKRAELLYADTDGVLLKEINNGAYMLSASSKETATRLIDSITDARLFLAHQEFCIPLIKSRFGLQNMLRCLMVAYTSKNSLPVSRKYEISVLTQAHAKTVIKYYHSMDDEDYIHNRIKNREMFGAFLDGKLTGFVGFHDDGSFGLLEVLPEYQRRGIGALLESYIINLHLQKGWTPFCNVLEDNIKSLSLQCKLGLKISKDPIFWVFK